MTRRAEIECVLDAKATLGEGTFWDTREQVLFFRFSGREKSLTGKSSLDSLVQSIGKAGLQA